MLCCCDPVKGRLPALVAVFSVRITVGTAAAATVAVAEEEDDDDVDDSARGPAVVTILPALSSRIVADVSPPPSAVLAAIPGLACPGG